MADKFLGHTNAVVLDGKLICCIIRPAAGLFHQTNHNVPTNRGKFNGIAKDIYQNLVQPQLVSNNILISHILGINKEVLLTAVYQPLNHGTQIMKEIRYVDRLFLQLYSTAFNTAHIQNIVYQVQQMGAGCINLSKVILHLTGIVYMGLGQCRKADNSIHRSADIMGHTVQENSLGPVSLLCRSQCQSHFVPLLLQLMDSIIYILKACNYMVGTFQLDILELVIVGFLSYLHLIGANIVLAVSQMLFYIFPSHDLIHILLILGMNPLRNILPCQGGIGILLAGFLFHACCNIAIQLQYTCCVLWQINQEYIGIAIRQGVEHRQLPLYLCLTLFPLLPFIGYIRTKKHTMKMAIVRIYNQLGCYPAGPDATIIEI